MVIGRIRQGKSVRILERLNTWENLVGLRSVWVRVRYDDLEGWVYGGFLSSSGYTMSSDSLDKPFILPIDPSQYRRTSKYGPRTHPINKSPSFHSGIDLAAHGGACAGLRWPGQHARLRRIFRRAQTVETQRLGCTCRDRNCAQRSHGRASGAGRWKHSAAIAEPGLQW